MNFADLAPEESLELLIEFGDELPELSAARATEQLDIRHLVKECQSPVYLWTDLSDGCAALEAHVTERSTHRPAVTSPSWFAGFPAPPSSKWRAYRTDLLKAARLGTDFGNDPPTRIHRAAWGGSNKRSPQAALSQATFAIRLTKFTENFLQRTLFP